MKKTMFEEGQEAATAPPEEAAGGNGQEEPQAEAQSQAIPPTEVEPPAGVPMARSRTPMRVAEHGIQIVDLDALWRFAGIVLASGLAPASFKSREAVAIAIEMGLELGMSPMMAMQNIAVINGRPGPFGAAVKGMIEKSGLIEEYDEFFEGTYPNDEFKAVVISKRVGRGSALRTEFSIGDAKAAKLWGKRGANGQDTPWTTYPKRMLMWRARQFNANDNFGDVTKGFRTAEQLQDDPAPENDETRPLEMPKRASEATAEAAPA